VGKQSEREMQIELKTN